MIQVQAGGSFDVDYLVIAPGDKVIMDGTKERQGDFVFTAQSIGEYRVCFNNEMSTFAEKLVDFEIAVCCFIFFSRRMTRQMKETAENTSKLVFTMSPTLTFASNPVFLATMNSL